MVITHIIGNGFDINQGLKTSYKDFYRDYYLKQDSSESVIDELKSAISGDIENWSDLELAIGKYTAHIASVEDLDIVMSDLQENLANYIAEIDSKQHTVEKKSADEIRQDLISPYRHLKAREIESFNTLKMNFGNVSDVNVLSFNYTLPEKIFPELNLRGKIINIHGNIESDIILGINDSGLYDTSYSYMVKTKDYANQLSLVRQKILEADELVIFGHSLGETDRDYFRDTLPFFQKRVIIISKNGPSKDEISNELMSINAYHIKDHAEWYLTEHGASIVFL